MPLGGGLFTTQNKTLPGTYINFVSSTETDTSISDRGVVAIPMGFDWCPDGEIFAVTAEEFANDAAKLFGYRYDDSDSEAMPYLREIFCNATSGYFYNLYSGGVKASCTYATAKYTGICGNNITIVIEENEEYTEESPLYDVTTYFDDGSGQKAVDSQTVADAADLISNDFVDFIESATLAATAGVALTGGTNGTVADANYQSFLDALESYTFNALGCVEISDTIQALFANYTVRMRDELGKKFQCVLHQYTAVPHEGIISVGNDNYPYAVPWVLGATAGCAINKSLTNKEYDGEMTFNTDYTQTALEAAIAAGVFMFHRVNDTVRVLLDINTLITTSDGKSELFFDNQTIRILDQIATDVAAIFNDNYLGGVANDASGRISLWNEIVKYHQELQDDGAIEDFYPDDITVTAGSVKGAVIISESITVIGAMEKLYMTVVVG